jgi:D,D-heptose 1,7-bisphosphate phosphatase
MVFEEASDIVTSPANTRPALLLDRDGTVIVEKDYLHDPDEVELEKGVVTALKMAQETGLAIVIVSNQSGIARGIFTHDDVQKVNARMLELLAVEGVDVDAVYYCPHHPHGSVNEFSIPCECRKPAAGMAEEAARELGIDLRRSFMVGDMVRDVDLGRVVGARSFLVRTGYGKGEEPHFRDWRINGEGSVCENLLEAVEHIRKLIRHD